MGIGASAGGLDAFKKLLSALPADGGMAYVLIQHLDPTHESIMADLLSGHTRMKVLQAADGMSLAPDHVYAIPPGIYLSIKDSVLHLSQPTEVRGARLPFDFFLRSLADECGERAVCVVLSGFGSDGSLGLKAVKEKGGLVIAQDPKEAAFDGMPRSAIGTGNVDAVLPLADIPEALLQYRRQGAISLGSTGGGAGEGAQAQPNEAQGIGEEQLNEIIALVSTATSHDFSSYKRGTLQRRLQRRMSMAGVVDWPTYVERLRANPAELRTVADDLLINVTQFFRDAAVFDLLAQTTVPNLVHSAEPDSAVRVWVPGCSTGEEAYSLAILFLEQIAAAKRNLKLQLFASDVDAEAVTFARAGLYPEAIQVNVTQNRLDRFFMKESHGYRVTPELRNTVVFAIHNLLVDAPFSRLDFISCRNVFIYLQPQAQTKALGLFHFALRPSGVLLLGQTETAESVEALFEPISRERRLYRRIEGGREIELPTFKNDASRQFLSRTPRPAARGASPSLGEAARQSLLEIYAPASVLINTRREGLYYFGAVDRYLQIASGEASSDVLAMAREGLQANLGEAIRRAHKDNVRAVVAGARVQRNGESASVTVSVQPEPYDGINLLLVSFIEEADRDAQPRGAETAEDASRVAQLERELDATRKDLHDALRDLEIANEEHKTLYEEARSVNEEFQSTNEELETSKEELQSLNEELVVLNGQLQEIVEQQRATFNDLQNILNSSDVATLFLDKAFKIRFFTPATTSLFNIISSDVGRPLQHLTRRFSDADLLSDAQVVLSTSVPVRREVETESGEWRIRRILPYRDGSQTEGVVVTFSDISELKSVQRELEAARDYAESIIATVRQPLVVVDEELRILSASRAFYEMFGAQPGETIGSGFVEALDDIKSPMLDHFLASIRAGGRPIDNQEIEIELSALGRRILLLSATDIRKEPPARRKILVSIDDVTESRRKREALAAAKLEAERANLGKSRFLAAASHDLRQPLQTITLLQSLLAERIEDESLLKVVERLDRSAMAMAGILDELLDINQLESGILTPQIVDFPIAEVFEALQSEFAYHAENHGLEWRVVGSSLAVRSDRRLLEQMIRNLLSNAVKYTKAGKLLLGCRRRGDRLSIEVWDTGIGIPPEELKTIFEEFRQLNNPARERAKGLGLGLSIVQRLAGLLGHQIRVSSVQGKGSVFAIEAPLGQPVQSHIIHTQNAKEANPTPVGGTLLIIEDDPLVRDALKLALEGEGYHVWGVPDGASALELAARGEMRPDLVIADYNLPNGLNGLEVVSRLRQIFNHQFEVIVLTGDISSETSREVASHRCAHFKKPVRTQELAGLIQRLLTRRPLDRMEGTEAGASRQGGRAGLP